MKLTLVSSQRPQAASSHVQLQAGQAGWRAKVSEQVWLGRVRVSSEGATSARSRILEERERREKGEREEKERREREREREREKEKGRERKRERERRGKGRKRERRKS